MKYSAILADPPWKFKVYSDKGLGRSAEAWYDCMSLDDIKSMPVKSWAANDCVLFLWVTDPFLRKGFEVLDSWGFEYKTVGFYWTKTIYSTSEAVMQYRDDRGLFYFPYGTGYWSRANPEQCLLATRGHPKRLNMDVAKLIIAPRREHSRKPDEIYSSIERLCAGPYLELFARQLWPNWDSLGLEVDTGPSATRKWKSNSGPLEAQEPKPNPPKLSDLLRNL